MAWIRLDCAMLSDEWALMTLTPEEFKAWTLFLLRVKSEGARGTVKIASAKVLSAQWFISEPGVLGMVRKALEKGIVEVVDNRWHVKNWWKYQEDHRYAKTDELRQSSTEFSGDAGTTTTPPHPTLHYTTPPPPTDGDGDDIGKNDIDGALLGYWGRDGHIGYLSKQEIVDLCREHTREAVIQAIKDSAGAKNKIQYMKAILKKRSAPVPQPKNKEQKPVMIVCSDCGEPVMSNELCKCHQQ